MPGKDKNYAVEGMRVKCSMGETMCTLNTIGHGVTYQGKSVLNANDHIPVVNITTFGVCTCTGVPCVPVTPLAWKFCNEEHMIDGAAALTTDSLCNCALGGVISIVDKPMFKLPESEMDDNLSKGLDGSFDSFISDKKITSFDKDQKSDILSQQGEPVEQLETEKEKDYNGDSETDSITKECSFVDKAKDTVFGKESAYDAERFEKAGIKVLLINYHEVDVKRFTKHLKMHRTK